MKAARKGKSQGYPSASGGLAVRVIYDLVTSNSGTFGRCCATVCVSSLGAGPKSRARAGGPTKHVNAHALT